MAPLLGVLAGAGLFLIWWSAWEEPDRVRKQRGNGRLQDLLLAAGVEKVTGAGLVGSCLGLGAFAMLAFLP
jgi:tight adherence protein B